MITKEKKIYILEKYSTTKELQSGENVNIIDENDFDKIAEEILSDDEIDWDDDFLSDD
jgi:hypothetical protein